MRHVRTALACVLLAYALLITRAYASTRTHPASVVCGAWAEDTAAYVHLIEYGDGRTVYRCNHAPTYPTP